MTVSLAIIPSKSGKAIPFYQFYRMVFTGSVFFCSAIALSKIYLSSDPRLQNITVKGEIVVNPNGKVYIRLNYVFSVYIFFY
jgi:amino acid permease